MASKQTIEYLCDLCGTGLGTADDKGNAPYGIDKVRITIIEHQEWSTDKLDAKEMCPECQQVVVDTMRELRKRK